MCRVMQTSKTELQSRSMPLQLIKVTEVNELKLLQNKTGSQVHKNRINIEEKKQETTEMGQKLIEF